MVLNFIREAARRNNEKRNSSSVLTRNVFPIIGDMTMTMTAGITQMRRIVQALHVRQGPSLGVPMGSVSTANGGVTLRKIVRTMRERFS